MFIGHFALGFGAKRLAPRVSLGTLFLACQFADLLWPTLVLAGLEWFSLAPHAGGATPVDFVHYPWSHSLIALVAWGVVFATIYWLARRGPIATAATLFALVVSHWVLDFVVHRPDLPLTVFATEKYGLSLWNSPGLTLVVEFVLFAAAVAVYARSTVARDKVGSMALWALVAFLSVIELANILGPPPPSTTAVAWSAQALWLLVIWAYWIDRHRESKGNATSH